MSFVCLSAILRYTASMKISISLPAIYLLQKKSLMLWYLAKHSEVRSQKPTDVLKEIAMSPITGIELVVDKKTTLQDIQKIKRLVGQFKLRIYSIHQPYLNLLRLHDAEIEKLLQFAKATDAKVVVIHAHSIGKSIFSEKRLETLRRLQKVYGVTLALENSQKVLPTQKYWWHEETFSNAFLPTPLSMTFDVAHMGGSGGDIVGFFKKHSKRIANIQLSDYGRKYHLPLGEGRLPISKLLKTVKKENYKGIITFEVNDSVQTICQNAMLLKAAVA